MIDLFMDDVYLITTVFVSSFKITVIFFVRWRSR